MVTGTKFSKKIFFAIFANWVILNRKIQKKIFSSINPPPPPLASRTKFSEKFFFCYFCELGDSEPEN